MKRVFELFVTCLAALLMLCVCAGAEEACQHWVLCEEPDVCAECGEAGISVPETDVVHEWLFTDLGKTHMLYCLYCDYEEEPEEHFAMCSDNTVCLGCGAKNLTLEDDAIIHDAVYTDLGMQHQYRCSLCGCEDEPENHWALCDDPVTCVGGGIIKLDIPEDEIYHEEKYLTGDAWHQVICGRCDYKEEQVPHTAVCTAQEVCYYCKAPVEVPPLGDMLHFDSNVETDITDTTHEKHCTHCGYSWGVTPHRVSCAEPTVCLGCGKTGLNVADDPVDHAGPFSGMAITGSGHSFDCGQCGRHVEGEAHTFDDGVCCICGCEKGADAPVRRPGDANDDGDVDISDALVVLQYSVGWGVSINHANADADGDGAVTIADALLILQYAVGWDVELK